MSSSGGTTKDLLDFLTEAELHQYFQAFQAQLKVTTIPQLKYVEDEDMQDLGMTKPEIRRLKKFFKKECPQGTFSKLRKILTTSKDGNTSPSSPNTSPQQLTKSPSRQVIPEDALTVLKPIGEGEFGTVSQGVWTDEQGERFQVAIKCLNKSKLGGSAADFLKEAASMQAVDHEHIVRLYGVVIAHDELRLVTELAPLRSLLECLKETALRASFPVSVLCEFACQIASGMAHLEEKRLIHRDLSARNILVYARDKVKISDFGLSRALGVGKDYYQTNFNVNLKLPIAWCAPECINFLKFTSASDVWAYGVTLWEMFSYGFQPWAALTGEQILEAIDEPNGQRLEQPDSCPKEHYGVMKKCWEHDPERRPTFQELKLMMPQLRPERVQTTCDCPPSSTMNKDVLPYRSHDLITVLDKRPENPPEAGLWRGVTESGKVGYIHSANTKPYIEQKTGPSPAPRRIKVARKESGRKSARQSKRLDATMIGVPEKDLRHMGHIGYDGAVFGDVSFIGNSYDKLPVKVSSPAKQNGGSGDRMSVSMTSSVTSIGQDDRSETDSADLLSLPLHSQASSSMSGLSFISQDDTLTDVSSMQDGGGSMASIPTLSNDTSSLLANGGGDDDFFKMPDLSSDLDLGLDFGSSSLMDDIMKSLTMSTMEDEDGNDNDTTATNSTLFDSADKSPLLDNGHENNDDEDNDFLSSMYDKTPTTDASAASMSIFGQRDNQNGRSTFDNFGLDNNDDGEEENTTDIEDEREKRQSSSVRDSVGSSLEGSDIQRGGVASDSKASNSEEEDTAGGRRRPKLRITIPSRRELDSAAGGVKPMSASDERKLDEAIELANEFAQEQQRSPRSAELNPGGGGGDSAGDSQSSSPRSLKGMFSLKKRDKSPKPEKKTFTEEFLGGVTDVGEEVTPEAQEAYNMLVVRGSEKNRSGGKGRTVRGNNANIRVPQGIPGRGGMKATAEPDSPSAQDSNPLRRLRESSFIAPKPKPKPQTKPKPGKTDANGSSMIQTHLPFFDKLKEQEQEHNYPGPGGDGLGFKSQPQQASEGTETSLSRPAPPPRNPLRSSTINSRPRERKNPLDLSNYTAKKSSSSVLNSSSEDSAFNTESDASSSASGGGGAVDRAGYRLSNPLAQSYTSATKSNDNSKTSSFTTTKTDSILPPTLPKSLPPQFQSPQHQQFSVKSVKLSATELGLGDAADAFWTDESAGDFEEMMRRGGPRMLGRYRTSDTVSYEDLLDFALDGGDGEEDGGGSKQEEDLEEDCFFDRVEREEGDMSDEVRLMKKVLSSHVSTEDSLYALEETGWDVHAAVKLLKLKQLLSATSSNKSPSTTDAEHAARCKAALIQHSWDVQRAADFLSPASPPLSPSSQLSPPSYNASTRGRESPELVHV